jgi:outer membrane protein assembly factor BamA
MGTVKTRAACALVVLALASCGGATPTPVAPKEADARAAACGAKSLPSAAHPVPADAPVPKGNIARVDVDDERLRGVVALRTGTPVDDAAIGATVRAVWATGLVDDVWIESEEAAGGVVLSVHTAPRRPVHALFLDAPAGFGEADAEKSLGLRAGAPLDGSKVATKLREVVAAFVDDGYLDASVAVSGVARPEGIDVCAKVAPGERATIAEVRVDGAKVLRAEDVRARVGDAGANAVGAPLRPAALDNAALRVETFAYEHGLLEAHAKIGHEGSGAKRTLVVTLREGPVYRVGKVTCVGAPAAVAACPDLQKRLPPGSVFRTSLLVGFMHELRAKEPALVFDPQTDLHHDEGLVDVTFRGTP